MKQEYRITIEGDRLPKDLSKDIAEQLDQGFLYEGSLPVIRIEKVKKQ